MPEIFTQKNGKMNDEDRLDLLRLLGKAGYIVWIGRRKKNQSGSYETHVSFVEPEKSGELAKSL